jgi:hypothetical protein
MSMGVKLDWEIEAEGAAYNDLGEHPRDRRQRHANRRRAALAILLIVGLIVGVVGLVMWRLWYVDHTIEQQLRDTVGAEMAALRIGDIAAYLNIQRSESNVWLLGQSDQFWAYQQLKQERDVDLDGQILDLQIDQNRARVLVEEHIDGVSYQHVWFYWRYEDGWRHVPADVTFWGETRTIEGPGYALTYFELDDPLAEALKPSLDLVWGEGCRWLACGTPLPNLAVHIVPESVVGVSWSPDNPDVLRIASPLTGRAPVDVPLDPATAHEVGRLLAERIVQHALGGLDPEPPADAAFLAGALEDWLVGRFLGDGGVLGSSFVESLNEAYGEQAVGMLARAIRPDAGIGVLSEAFGLPLDEINVDWREFFQWRLALEPFMLARGDQAGLLSLYDDLAVNEALALIDNPAAANQTALTVVRVVTGPGEDGTPRAWAVVRYPDDSEGPITFRLVEGDWKRSTPDAAFPG